MYVKPEMKSYTVEELEALGLACASPCNCRGYCTCQPD